MNNYDYCLHISEQWHEYAKTREIAKLIELYDKQVTFESPLVPAIWDDMNTGVLIGHNQILQFLSEGTKKKPSDLVRWYSTGEYFTDGQTLYGSTREQHLKVIKIDILELMEIFNEKNAPKHVFIQNKMINTIC